MKIDSQLTQNIDKSDMQVQLLPEDTELLELSDIPFSEFISKSSNVYGAEENQDLLSSLDIDFNYDSMSMSFEDALFFVNLAQDGQFTFTAAQNGDFSQLVQTDTIQNVVSQRNVEVTNQLTDLIEKAKDTQKPVRISFDNDVSVVIKIDKSGKVSAEFIPSSSEAESYLRNNIASLKQKFDEQNLPYNDLLYRQNKDRNGSRQSKRENKGERE